jgi:hypothetical protein
MGNTALSDLLTRRSAHQANLNKLLIEASEMGFLNEVKRLIVLKGVRADMNATDIKVYRLIVS